MRAQHYSKYILILAGLVMCSPGFLMAARAPTHAGRNHPVAGTTAANALTSSSDETLTETGVSAGVTALNPVRQATFQQGVNGYTGTVDTFLAEGLPDASQGTLDIFVWDLVSDTWGDASVYGLLRFDAIFGPGANQIPPGAIIHSAVLTYVVSDPGDPGMVNEVAVDWDQDETWNNFGPVPGVQNEDYGSQVATAPGNPVGTYSIDVTASLAAWTNNPASNRGWIFRPSGTGGVRVYASEHATVSERPLLIVNYSNPPTSAPDAPVGLSIDTITSAQIALSWVDNSDNEANFEIKRSTTGIGGPFSLLATVGADTTTYNDQDVLPDTEYCYRVRATNIIGDSTYTAVVYGTTPLETNTAVQFGTQNAYITFGQAPSLGLATFTIECWFKRSGPGSSANTGTGGFQGIPLVTKGRGEVDASDNRDMNYFLGIRASDNVLAADFEEGAGGSVPGQNHPVYGTTVIANNIWYHAAATYDGSKWQLFLNGQLEAELTVNQPPRSDSIQHAGLGVALDSNGAASGHFNGVIDEVRIWDYARTPQQIRSTINSELSGPQTGLVARWSLNEGTGSAVSSSAGTIINGTIMNSGWSWVAGAPFDLSINLSPDQPTLESPAAGAVGVELSPALEVSVTDPESDTLTVTFYGRRATGGAGDNFTIIALPDTQYYSRDSSPIFSSQTQWIVEDKDADNIVYVAHLGDIVEVADDTKQWDFADEAMSRLENALTTGLPDGIPYSMVPGNHDYPTVNYNLYFGISRFVNRAYYGGHFATDNNNNYTLFSAGGMDFIAIGLEYGPTASELAWAESLLQAYSDRRAIVITHSLLGTGDPAAFTSAGQATFNALQDNANLFLMMGGHVPGEGRRQDQGTNGNTIYSLLADYQSRDNDGDGWLRILAFSPSSNEIWVETYSPTLNQYETDEDSDFTLDYDMQATPFEVIGTSPGVPSGSTAGIVWPDLDPAARYEWYVTVSDGQHTITSPMWSFTTVGIAGDLDGDCDVDGADLARLASEFGCTQHCSYDLTGDGVVDQNDLAELALHYGELCP